MAQNSQIAKLPAGLLKKVNIFGGALPGVVEPNTAGESIVQHHSPISMYPDVASLAAATEASCPTCEAMGKHLEEIEYNPSLPHLAGSFE